MSDVNVNDIIKAKEIVRNAGLDCSLPDNKLDIAKNVAQAAGYTVQKQTPVQQAIDVARNAGYTVSRAPAQPAPAAPNSNQLAQALDVATKAGYTVKKAPSVPTKPVQHGGKSQEDINYGWIEQAAANML